MGFVITKQIGETFQSLNLTEEEACEQVIIR